MSYARCVISVINASNGIFDITGICIKININMSIDRKLWPWDQGAEKDRETDYKLAAEEHIAGRRETIVNYTKQ